MKLRRGTRRRRQPLVGVEVKDPVRLRDRVGVVALLSEVRHRVLDHSRAMTGGQLGGPVAAAGIDHDHLIRTQC